MAKYLIDTNIFLEILLEQEKKEKCKSFLVKNFGELVFSDFSLHSVGIILFRNQKHDLFLSFINDVLPKIQLTSIEKHEFSELENFASRFHLDFDDAYQATLAKELNLTIVTMDKDFERIKKSIKVKFII
jgi:predicted nucleic acid-binding protein